MSLTSFLASLGDGADEPQSSVEDVFATSVQSRKRPRQTPEKAKRKADESERADKSDRTVFVGNVPLTALKQRAKLKRLFQQYGKVESVRLRSVAIVGTAVPSKSDFRTMRRVSSIKGAVAEEGPTSCNAYVVYKDPTGATNALSEASELQYEGHTLRVDRIRVDGAGQEFDRRRCVFVGNLPFNVSDEAVRSFFERHLDHLAEDGKEAAGVSPVESVRLIRDRATNLGKGFGYVLARTEELHGKMLTANGEELAGRAIRVSKAERSATSRSSRRTAAKPSSLPAFMGRKTGVLARIAKKGLKSKGRNADGSKRRKRRKN